MANVCVEKMEDQNLLEQLQQAARCERSWQVASLIYLAEVDQRRLHLKLGYKSLFEFCVERLRWSEGSVYRRIQVARKGVHCPMLLQAIREQKLTLTVAAIIVPTMTAENAVALIEEFSSLSRRQAEDLLAKMGHQKEGPRPESIRLIGQLAVDPPRALGAEPQALGQEGQKHSGVFVGEPNAMGVSTGGPPSTDKEEIYSFRFTGNRRLRDKVLRAKAVMASKLKSVDIDDVLEAALDCLLDKHDPKRREERMARRDAVRLVRDDRADQSQKPTAGAKKAANPSHVAAKDETSERSRYISAPTERFVLKRSDHRCEWTADGHRCTATSLLQIDHIVSFAKGGRPDPSNLQVLCRAHNLLKARIEFGDAKMDLARQSHPGRAQ